MSTSTGSTSTGSPSTGSTDATAASAGRSTRTASATDGPTPGWRLVAVREISVKMRDKAFLGSTAFLLVTVVAAIGLTSFLSGRTSEHTVAVLDDAGTGIVQDADERGRVDGGTQQVAARQARDVGQALAWVRAEDVDAALLPLEDDPSATGATGQRWEVVGGTGVDNELQALLDDAVASAVLSDNAQAAGTSTDELLRGTETEQRLLDSSTLPEGAQFGIGFAFAMLFYLTALTFGLAIAQSVVEEKQSRVVEILVAAVPVRQLLAGKVVGNSALAIAQVVLLAAVGLVGLSVTGRAATLSPVLLAGGWFVVFFVLGFAALACLWAVAGSVATRQEDLQATTTPMTFVVMIALFAGIFSEGTPQVVLSFVPLVSTVAMPARMLAGDVALWQPVLAAVLVAVSAVLLVRLGARLYEGSILKTDRRIPLKEAFSRS